MRFETEANKLAVIRAMDRLWERMGELAIEVHSSVGAYQASPQVAEVVNEIRQFRAARKRTIGEAPLDVPDSLRPVVVAALLHWRNEKASNLERAYSKLVDRSVVSDLTTELKTLDDLVAEEWVKETQPKSLPQLVDIVTLEIAETGLRREWESGQRMYDEKFHILQAPQLLLRDLAYLRKACSMRGLSVGVAFVDIDDFKSFNSDLGEPAVDVLVLPRFMRAVEAAVFGRGFAYRQGGDEYVLCLPNVEATEFAAMLERLRSAIATLQYVGVNRRSTVSIGFVVLDPDSPFTDQEVLAKAAQAKDRAKSLGKDRVESIEF